MTQVKKLPRARSGSFRTFLLYLPVLLVIAGTCVFSILWVWPRYLANAAPTLAAWVPEPILRLLPSGVFREGMTVAERLAVYAARDRAWLMCIACLQGAGLVWMLLAVLLWRGHVKRRCVPQSVRCRGAVISCAVCQLLVLLGEAALCLLTWELGVKDVVGRTVWDWLCDFGTYPLCVLGSLLLTRLGAPACISGRGGWFRRL